MERLSRKESFEVAMWSGDTLSQLPSHLAKATVLNEAALRSGLGVEITTGTEEQH